MLTTDTHTDTFLSVRTLLLGIANKIVRDAADPEDVVQDAWLRWNRTDRDVVRDATAFLCQITIRLALTTVRSAHVRHRSPYELPMDQPDVDADPALTVESMERVREATYLMVHRLTPREQAAYVLRESFAFPYPDIGDLVGCTEANARQMIRRARLRLRGKPSRSPSSDEQRRLLAAFLYATRSAEDGRSDMTAFVDAVVPTDIQEAWQPETG
ncbi:RNA polymerase subunit sigma-24 [Actinoplanes sp. TBRC 11911]|uniref:sigma factor-like helix-turn-helix DNA-binding protein n=1 Tax=Actinoplanes sp. TBRC 11911 TaxID=2729386 RepID=UPI00145C4F08|nr:sigma factor-like helix-turn-helix DNA-binding protein [Actinoplanes sp. TBRC 11911]NMO50116.1 RNA polymerase subunit sigma-24 [Actinoplanes sp. TBRC 11911]